MRGREKERRRGGEEERRRGGKEERRRGEKEERRRRYVFSGHAGYRNPCPGRRPGSQLDSVTCIYSSTAFLEHEFDFWRQKILQENFVPDSTVN